ncbi:UDP-glycosyltransferase 74G1-like [Impatiens glandulifera]|uniref:UDP-glycosyltransferase 74G1-like n=1 Tax=Impatiens glandulifera TaxID=253017 RepID=UPI001FB06293|nr:UDP-glycosyltransferase 74G1-like [Impatiens glandulifera]
MEKRNEKVHVLVVPYPAQGHINPMIQFCKRLINHNGIKCTLALTLHLSKTITPTATATPNIIFETISDGCDRAGFSEAGTSEIYLEKLRENGSRTLEELIVKLNSTGNPVDVIIYDGFLPWALDVGKRFGLLGVLFFTQTCSVNAIYYHVHQGNLKLPLTQSTVSLPGLPLLLDSETPSYVHVYGDYPGFSHTVVNQFSNIDKADWVLFNSFYDMEKEVLDWARKLWRRVITIGPTLPSLYLDNRLKDDTDYDINLFNPDSSSCLNWLNTKPPNSVVYVSFGSMADLTPAQIAEIASGLEDTNQFFIWVVRSSESAKLPENFKPEKGLVVAWCPQLQVLANPSTGCFVTHCGFNSVIEAMSLGVGIVAVPQWSDQITNGKFVEEVWGIGIRAKKDVNGIVRREVLRDCIKEVMEGDRGREIGKNLLKWKKLSKEAIDEGGSSDKNIDEFCKSIINHHLSL